MPENNLNVTIYDSSKKQNLASYLIKVIRQLYVYRYAYYNFVTNTLATRYRRSALGFLWTLINPLMNLTILAIVFSLVFKQEIRTFGVYVFSALSPWTFISASLNGSPTIFIYAESYIKKVYIPKFLFPLTLISVEAINFFFSMVSIYIIFIFLGAKLNWVMLLTPLPMLITFVFAIGLSLLVSIAHVYFRDVSHIVQMAVSALMFTLPIMYPIARVPAEYQFMFALNPFYHFIHLFRIIVYDGSLPTLVDWLIPSAIAIGTLLLGFFVLMKQDLDLVFRL